MNIGTEKTSGIKVINYLVWFRFNRAYLPREKFVEIVKGVGLDEFTIPRLPKKTQAVRQAIREIFSSKNIAINGQVNRLTVFETGRDPELIFHISGSTIDHYKKDYATQKICSIIYDALKDKIEVKTFITDTIQGEKGTDIISKMADEISGRADAITTDITNKQIADYVTYYLENTIRFRATAGLYYIHPKHMELLEKLKALVNKVNAVAKQELAKMEFNYIGLIDDAMVSDSLVGSIQDEAEEIRKKIEGAKISSDESQKLLERVHQLRQKAKESEDFFRSQHERVDTLLNNLDASATEVISAALEKGEIDTLTQLYTRARFMTLVHNLLANNPDASWCVAMADIDYFKKLNDTYGHQFGDRCLKIVADTIKSKLREPDIAGRYGGEEFVLFFLKPADSGKDTCEDIRKALEKTKPGVANVKGSDRAKLTLSFGIAGGNKDKGLEAVIGQADKLLYKAKNGGRNRVEGER